MVSGLFHSPRRGAFHRSLTVLVHYRSLAVFSLGLWSAQLPARFRVSGGTHVLRHDVILGSTLRGSHPLRRPVPVAFRCPQSHRERAAVRSPQPSNPRTASPAGCTAARVWAPPRSLAATRGILSFPRGTKMFQFPRFPPEPKLGSRVMHAGGCPIRRPPDHRMPAPPRGVSPRGHVLHRPPTPRHPPCAHHRDVLAPGTLDFQRSPRAGRRLHLIGHTPHTRFTSEGVDTCFRHCTHTTWHSRAHGCGFVTLHVPDRCCPRPASFRNDSVRRPSGSVTAARIR
jgi:hypothetical protein